MMGFLDKLKFWKKVAEDTPTVAEVDPYTEIASWVNEERRAAIEVLEAEVLKCESVARQAKLTATRVGIEAFAARLIERIEAAQAEPVK